MKIFFLVGAGVGLLWWRGGMSTADPIGSIKSGAATLFGGAAQGGNLVATAPGAATPCNGCRGNQAGSAPQAQPTTYGRITIDGYQAPGATRAGLPAQRLTPLAVGGY